jgi:hypothetical protein
MLTKVHFKVKVVVFGIKEGNLVGTSVKKGVCLSYKKTTKKRRNEPRLVWKVRGSRKILSGKCILFWKVRRSQNISRVAKPQLKASAFSFWNVRGSRKVLGAREI